MAIIEHLLKKITEYVQDAWNGYMDIRAVLTGMETNSHLLQMSASEDVILVVEMEVRVKELATKFYLAMPAANVEELTSKFGFKYVQKTKRRDNGAARRVNLVQNLLETEVELRAILQRFELDAQEVMKLQVGDVVPLNRRIDSDVEVMVEDVLSFTAKPGHTKLRKAVQIEKVL